MWLTSKVWINHHPGAAYSLCHLNCWVMIAVQFLLSLGKAIPVNIHTKVIVLLWVGVTASDVIID